MTSPSRLAATVRADRATFADGNPSPMRLPKLPFVALGYVLEGVLHLADLWAYHTRPRR